MYKISMWLDGYDEEAIISMELPYIPKIGEEFRLGDLKTMREINGVEVTAIKVIQIDKIIYDNGENKDLVIELIVIPVIQ